MGRRPTPLTGTFLFPDSHFANRSPPKSVVPSSGPCAASLVPPPPALSSPHAPSSGLTGPARGGPLCTQETAAATHPGRTRSAESWALSRSFSAEPTLQGGVPGRLPRWALGNPPSHVVTELGQAATLSPGSPCALGTTCLRGKICFSPSLPAGIDGNAHRPWSLCPSRVLE